VKPRGRKLRADAAELARKTLRGTHRGELMGIAPTGRAVAIEVIDIVRLRDGRYVEHWNSNNLLTVLADLRALG
jgi:predicted ester cyclase